MDEIKDLMIKAQSKIGSEAESAAKSISAVVMQLVNDLFTFFYGICRGFTKQYSDPKRLNIEKTQWMKAFEDEGITTREQIDHGIKRTRRETPIYTPTIGQFLDWCMPDLNALGIPALDAAYMEACKNSHFAADKVWSHKLVQHAWKLTGSYLLATTARSTSYPLFKRNYEEAIKQWRAGKHIDEIEVPKVLTKIADPVKTAEMRRKSLKESYIKLGRLDLAAKFDDSEEI